MFNTPRVLGGFPILALHPKSLRQIGELGVFGTNSGSVNEPLMGGSFCVGNGVGIEVLAKSIFVRGVSPFHGWRTLRPLHPKSLRQIGELGVFGTNSGSINEPLMGGSFCLGNGVGIEVLAKPIFVRGVSPFNGSGPAVPFNGSGATASISVSGWRALFFVEAALPPGAPCA